VLFRSPVKSSGLKQWKSLLDKMKNADKVVKIGVIGKYVSYGIAEHKDVYLSVLEAVKHACAHLGVKPIIEQVQSTTVEENGIDIIKKYDGIIIPGGFGSSGVEGKIDVIRHCRENGIPFLGLCFGFQMAVIEFARHVCGMNRAHSTEIDAITPYPVIDLLPEQKELIKLKQYGATMRLGGYPAVLKEGSKVFELYGKKKEVAERHRHRYEVNPDYIGILEERGLVFSGQSPDRRLMEFLEMPNHRFFVATQAHPEFKSRFEEPSPLFMGFVKACLENPVQKTLEK